jgi:GPH family glycoside/pentoside/hexuronide:cation symporter
MLTDTIAFDRVRSGISREGMFSGVFSALEKLAFALGPAIAGVALSVAGFVESRGGAGLESPGAIEGIVISLSVLPVLLTASSLLVLRRYRL